MITKKKLKTKLDYEIRTFGFCVLLVFIFTLLFVNPQIQKVNDNNASLQQEIKKEENINNRLKFENEEIIIESTIKNED